MKKITSSIKGKTDPQAQARRLSYLESFEVDILVFTLRICVSNASMRERLEVALLVSDMIWQLAGYGSSESVRARLVLGTCFLVPLVRLFDDEKLLSNSQLHKEVCQITTYLSKDRSSTMRADLLISAGWANLLVKALRARPYDKRSLECAGVAIFCLLLYANTSSRATFNSAGAREALREALERFPSEIYCRSALLFLNDDV
mmetsp:Transcript_33915/g.49265  ORF Transcript_33915/g.49265 Transcript_33915/m.49265 type:complete len:203 (-) Transcript_33915:349-957(-)